MGASVLGIELDTILSATLFVSFLFVADALIRSDLSILTILLASLAYVVVFYLSAHLVLRAFDIEL